MGRPVFNVDPLPIPENVDASQWPGATLAARSLGMKPLQFRQLIREGGLKEYKAKDKSRRYDPDEIDELAERLADGLDEQDEEITVGGKPIEGMRAATDLLKQSQGHNERLLTTAILGFEKAMTAMSNVVQYLTEENAKLTSFKYEAIGTLENARSVEMQTAVEASKAMAAEERRQKLVAAVVPHIGPVLTRVAEALGNMRPNTAGEPQQQTDEQPTSQAPAEPPGSPVPDQAPVQPSDLERSALELLRRIGPERLRLAAMVIDEEDQPLANQVIDQLGKDQSKCDCSTEDHA